MADRRWRDGPASASSLFMVPLCLLIHWRSGVVETIMSAARPVYTKPVVLLQAVRWDGRIGVMYARAGFSARPVQRADKQEPRDQ